MAFWALVTESGITTLALVSSGLLIGPLFVTLTVAQFCRYLAAGAGRLAAWECLLVLHRRDRKWRTVDCA